MEFTVIDTGGLDDREGLESRMLPLTSNVLRTADVVLFLVDARRGVTPEDKFFAQYAIPCSHMHDMVPASHCNACLTIVVATGCVTVSDRQSSRCHAAVTSLRWVRKNRAGPLFLVANKTDGLLDREDAQVPHCLR